MQIEIIEEVRLPNAKIRGIGMKLLAKDGARHEELVNAGSVDNTPED